MSGTYELHDHTADVAVRATGPTIEAVFSAVGDGLAAAASDGWPDEGSRFELTVSAEGREALLFDYLDELIYQRDVRNVLPVDNEVSIEYDGDRWSLTGSARGVPTASVDAREIKAVTYSEMVIEETEDGWTAYVVFDV